MCHNVYGVCTKQKKTKMDLIREKLKEIEDQALAVHERGEQPGIAIREWEDAREIRMSDIQAALAEHVDVAQLMMSDPRGLMIMAFRWGYEVAVAKERASGIL